jgi:phenylalanyl-tRNA synthetase beta chain
VGLGLLETRAMPFVGERGRSAVRVANPLSEAEAYLRGSVLDTLARRAEHNLAHMQRSIRLFEIGAVFLPPSGERERGKGVYSTGGREVAMTALEHRLPVEELHVAALVLGPRRPPHFTDPTPPDYDQWDLKFIAQVIANAIVSKADLEFIQSADEDRLWSLSIAGRAVGVVSRVSLDAPVWASAAYGVEMDIGALLDVQEAASITYIPLPATPAAEFDLALIVPDGVLASRVEAVMRAQAGELLERAELFDEFRSDALPAGSRSLAWRLTFRHPERTLRDKEIEARKEKLLRTLDQELGVRQRTS